MSLYIFLHSLSKTRVCKNICNINRYKTPHIFHDELIYLRMGIRASNNRSQMEMKCQLRLLRMRITPSLYWRPILTFELLINSMTLPSIDLIASNFTM